MNMTTRDTGRGEEELSKLLEILHDESKMAEANEEQLQRLRISNLNAYLQYKINQDTQAQKKEMELILELQKIGLDGIAKEGEKEIDFIRRIKEEKLAALAEADAAGKAQIEAEYKLYEDLAAARKKLDDKARKDKLKEANEEAKKLKKLGLDEAEVKAKLAEKLVNEGVYKDIADALKSMSDELKATAEETKAEAKKAAKEDASKKTKDAGAKFLQSMLDFTKQLDSTITDIANMKSQIDTRLYGSKANKSWTGSYWDQISSDITGIAGISPLVKQSDIVNNLRDMVNRGIAFDVEQRAFLQTISDKIATTFNANDAALTKLIRIQAADTTAARLGMEAALNAFLNNMYETTEYMTDAAASIRGNLYEAAALMSATNATEFEYQVQKWMGSLYSVGMSQEAVTGISAALGKLSAGQIEGITDGGFGNLLIMAANNAGLSIADILQNGLNANGANRLMTALVNYLGNIYKSTSNNRVVSQQFAKVFGVSASDLKAAESLQKSTAAVYDNNLNYSGMISNLYSMANSMYSRVGMGELLTNAFDNFKYTMAAGVATNPALFAIYKMANALDSVVGGIALPDIKVMGTGVNLQTTVADLMRVAALSGGLLQGVGSMISSGGNGGITGAGLLKAAGINTSFLNYVSRGGKQGMLDISGSSVSESGGYVGNTEGSDVYNQTMTSANDSAKQQLIEAQDESEETTLNTVDEHVIAIYQLLQDVTSGSASLHMILDSSIPFTAVTPTITI